ncbi:MAG: polyprenyl synthetase family protein [Lachnospiraceae bacterium]
MGIELLQEKVKYANRVVCRFLPAAKGLQKTIMEACDYSVRVGGKRVRPVLMNEVYLLCNGSSDNAECLHSFMAAIEMIHTYSLVHDDLPAMDNDDYRRGNLTTHKKYGEDMGILAGDALLNLAFEVIFNAGVNADDKGAVIRAGKILAEKAGIFGMIGGQVVDVEKTGQAVSKEEMDFIFRLKTGALIEASMMCGAVLAGADEDVVKAVERAGYHIGMAFQIKDDILDVTSTTEVLGKPVFSDEKNNKTTYVSLFGMEKAATDVEKHSKEAVAILKSVGDNEFLIDFVKYLINREK